MPHCVNAACPCWGSSEAAMVTGHSSPQALQQTFPDAKNNQDSNRKALLLDNGVGGGEPVGKTEPGTSQIPTAQEQGNTPSFQYPLLTGHNHHVTSPLEPYHRAQGEGGLHYPSLQPGPDQSLVPPNSAPSPEGRVRSWLHMNEQCSALLHPWAYKCPVSFCLKTANQKEEWQL